MDAALETALVAAGDNRAELETFLARFNHDPAMARAAEFLTANLPLCDAVSMDADLLSQNLTLAFLAQRSMDWGEAVDQDLFLHYVLPHRVAQEPAEPWRGRLYGELAPLAASCSSMEEAALAVNQWCAAQVSFRPTTGWDLGPLAVLRRGYGRCEENAILLAAALRSVAIPARLAIVPAWQHTDGNHAWVEAWLDGEWRILEAADATAGLDRAWFTPSLALAPLTVAVSCGVPDDPDAPLMRTGQGFALLNTTARHAPVQELSVQVTGLDGQPFAGGKAYLAVANSGALRPMISLDLDDEGRASVLMGAGTVLVTAGQGDAADFGLWSWLPGQDSPATIYIDLRRNRLPQGELLFRLPETAPAAAPEPLAAPPIPLSADFEPLAQAGLRSLGLESVLLAPATAAGANAPGVLRAWEQAPPQLRPLLVEMLLAMEPKDLAVAQSADLLAEARQLSRILEAAEARENALDDESRDLLLASRQEWEPFTPWRSQLAPLVQELFGQGEDAGLARLNRLTASLPAAKRRDLGPMLTPVQTLRAGAPVEPDEAALLAACVLNAAGIPARFLPDEEFVEYRLSGLRLPLFPADPALLGSASATERSRAWFAEPATLRLFPAHGGEPLSEDQFAYFQHFTLNRLVDGRLEPVTLELDLSYDQAAHSVELVVPAGQYLLLAAGPVREGERRVLARTLDLAPGQTSDLALDMPN